MRPILERLRKRWTTLLLLVGALGAGYVVAPHVPKDRTLDLALDDPKSVTTVELAWSRADGTDALQGGTWRFAAGTAPSKIHAPLHLPDGRYRLDVTVERGGQREGFQRTITLGDADRIAVRSR